MINILNDCEKLTNVKQNTLSKLCTCANYSIVDNVKEQYWLDNNIVDLDIGIGVLTIEIIDDSIKYHFRPSKELETGLVDSINDNFNPLEEKLSKNIDRYIYKSYKDML